MSILDMVILFVIWTVAHMPYVGLSFAKTRNKRSPLPCGHTIHDIACSSHCVDLEPLAHSAPGLVEGLHGCAGGCRRLGPGVRYWDALGTS